MDEKKVTQLDDEQLDQVSGGIINVFDAPAFKCEYWKYTCHTCGSVGVVAGRPAVCANCHAGNITCEEYKP